MNRLLYRVVFNKARSMLMVVADIARACSGGSPSSGTGHNHRRLICRLSTISLSLWLASGAVQTAQAAIVADKSAPGKQQPTVIASANGTPQVNIQTPSAGGVSRNTYSRFDVDKKGVILNNARKNTATQLGGMVSANPWLAKGEAKIILNEVNARDPSRLNGYIEVAGQKAQVVIASPSGITCNGCGFINAGRATLTTGTAQMQNGNLTGYQVNRGEVVIEGKGLDSSRQDYTDIIARTVKVNASIYAGDLKVTTGRNRVDAAHETTTAQADDGSLKPQLALDVSQVGGMYAGKIRLRATEQGVGVRNAGTIGSEAGLVTIMADGRIENSGELSSQQSLQVSSASGIANSGKMLSQQGLSVNTTGGISNSGTVWSSADAMLAASGAVQNSGSVAARNNVALAGSSLTSSSKSTLAAGVQSDGHTGSGGDLTLSASGKLEMNGLNLAGGSIRAAGQGLDASGSQTQAKNITLNAKQGDLTTASAQVIASGTLTAMTAGTLNNAAGQVAADKLSLTARRLENQQGQLIQSGTQSLTLSHQDGINNHGGLIQSGGDMRLDAQQNALINRDTQDSGGIISFGRLNVTAGKISNQNGMLAGAGETAVQATEVDNSEGTLASESGLQLSAQSVNNRGGALSSGLEMALKLTGTLDNSTGNISSGGSLNIDAGKLDNQQGVAVAGGGVRLNVKQTDNRQGQLAAQGNLILNGEALNNDAGLIQSGNALTLTARQISNRNSGESGGITSQGDMQISASALDNDQGLLLAGKQAGLDADTFSNIAGTLVALETLKLTVQSDIDNRQGLLQGGGMVLNTNGHLLDNREGTLNSLAAMQLATAGLNNQHGTLGAKGDLTLQAGWLDNSNNGRVVGESSTALRLAQLLNSGGQIQTVGNLLIDVVQGVIDNTQGLIRSGAIATLNAATLTNRDTLKAEKGIEGQSIVINSGKLDNAVGSMLAGQNLSVTNSGTLDNSRGELAASYALTLGGSSLNLINSAGVVKAGQQVTVQAERLGGDGKLLSLGNMALSSRSDISNSGEMIANGSFSLTTPGSVTNSGKLLAGAKLDLSSGNLLNAATGEISAGSTWLTVADTLTNTGLIDGTGTRLQAGTLTNSGAGRIYGDYLGIQAGTLNNLAADGVAATIAGRERVDIGAGTLNNLDHALIYSGGALALGDQLNANGMAAGQAGELNNHSATIESAGDMALSVGQLNNINDRFTTEVVQVSTEQITEYQHKGSSIRWSADEEGVFIDRNSADKLLNLNTPENTGHNNDNFYQYDYIRTTEEEVIRESDPGKILSGGNLAISADRVLNDKSQIVAGGTLGIAADSVDNVMPEGSRRITDAGSVTHYSRKSHKGGDEQKKSTTEYVPPTVIQSITLKPGRLEGNSQPDGSGLQPAVAQPQGTNATIGHTGSLSAAVTESDIRPGLQDIRVDGENGQAMVVRVTWPDTRLPDSSLFTTHPAPEAGYLVETDPRFTRNKQWLGSDYMQDAFSLSGDNLHKRLGDGYYEQRLVREQIIALTGGRYLADWRDDEAQFKGLMDAGIAFGRKYNLIPGVALTAEQMSLLTEDMVWLVNTEVVLADGTRQTVMVPQVYARVKEGDMDGPGALLGGQQAVMNLNGDLLNSGTIRGREMVQLSAENITNRAGTVQGADVSLQARTDISNIAGMIAGRHSVLASAGRDINILSTTRSAQGGAGENRFERTTLDRVAGVYVQGADGTLSLSAGRDISLTGGQVASSGSRSRTVLSAGRDLSLNAVVTSAGDNLTWDKDNWLKQSVTQHTGSEVTGAGSVLLMAGQDVNAQAATVFAGDSLGVVAGRDIRLTAATNSSNVESHHKSTGSNGAFSKTTVTTHDMVNGETAQGTQFSGDSVTMQADNDLRVQGSSVAGDNDVRLTAGNHLTVTTAEERGRESHQRQEKKSGLSGTGGIGFSYGTQALKVTDTLTETTQRGSTVGSVKGNVTLSAGNTLTVKGSELVAGQDMALSGKQVDILAAENSSTQMHKVEQKSSGLTLALSGAAGSAVN